MLVLANGTSLMRWSSGYLNSRVVVPCFHSAPLWSTPILRDRLRNMHGDHPSQGLLPDHISGLFLASGSSLMRWLSGYLSLRNHLARKSSDHALPPSSQSF